MFKKVGHLPSPENHVSSSRDEVQLAAETPLETFRYLTVYSVSELEATEGFIGVQEMESQG